MYEFETFFDVNTGDLTRIFSGSGVHLNKDVTFSFGLIDQQTNTVSNDQQLIANPLINNISFDILNSSGSVVVPNYLSGGTTRSITITESENQSIFGTYTKDFGVRLIMSNYLDNEKFTGVFQAFGNTPNITSFTVSDDYFSAIDQSFDEIPVYVAIGNNLKYVAFDRYDIYASTEDEIVIYNDPAMPIKNNPSFLYSQKVHNVDNILNISIKPVGLDYNTPYYFKIVPYSNLGSGNIISFGPKSFIKEGSGDPLITVSSNQFELFDGGESMILGYTTGAISGPDPYPIDFIETGLYNTFLYTSQIQTGDIFTSSELKLSLNTTGTVLIENSINNNGQLIYSVDQSGLYYVLNVSGVNPTGLYKIYKTSI